MAELQLSREQKQVIESRDGQLLVSAAAGSGKTFVLIQRLLYRICGEEHANLDDFLIITYTKAAAAELRSKIAEEITNRLGENPDQPHLADQMSRLYTAQISTVHSFCADLLRRHAPECGLDPAFRVMEDTESTILKEKTLEKLFRTVYAEPDAYPWFRALESSLGYGHDDSAAGALILNTYSELQCYADPDGWLENVREKLQEPEDPGQSESGRDLIVRTAAMFEDLAVRTERLCTAAEEDEEIKAKYVPALRDDASQYRNIAGAQTWEELRGAKALPPMRMGSVKDEKCDNPDLKENIQNCRKDMKETVKKLLAPFAASAEETRQTAETSAEQIAALFDAVQTFSAAYTAEKKRVRALDFSDLEHEACRLLARESMAEAVSRQYLEVMVDEYQDTNEVQDRIFSAVSSKGKQLFLVGDVKQSIYRFRKADPGIFLKKYYDYKPAEDAQPGEPRKILLSCNYRSRREILEAVNHVFRHVMTKQVGEVDYGDAEALVPQASFTELPGEKVEFWCIDPKSGQTPMGKAEAEAAFAAARISQMLAEGTPIQDKNAPDGVRPVTPGDIVILMRSPKNTAPTYIGKLRELGIPASAAKDNNILDSSEVQVLLAVLRLIDNPRQDVSLAALLNSPVSPLSLNVLAEARAACRKADLYTALRAYAKENQAAKDFLNDLAALRKEAQQMQLSELVYTCMAHFRLTEIFGARPDGAQRKRNLQAFAEYAASYASGSFRMLSDFLGHIRDLQKEKKEISAGDSDAANAVRILTMHTSKGLEYPVVFLCGLSHGFNREDFKERILFDATLGAGATLVKTKTMEKRDTYRREAIRGKKNAEMVSEEMRLLYVAMTRAKEYMVMSYCDGNIDPRRRKYARELPYGMTPYLTSRVYCMGDWVLMAAMLRKESAPLYPDGRRTAFADTGRETPWKMYYRTAEEIPQGIPYRAVTAAGKALTDDGIFGYQYPYAAATAIPSKLTATQMKGRQLDAELSGTVLGHGKVHFSLPGDKKSAAFRGSATHLAMQYLNFTACRENGVERELLRMQEQGFLTEQQRSEAFAEEIERLVCSDLGEKIRQFSICKEKKFSLLMPASLFVPDAPAEERIMIDGVADCILRTEQGLVILDYKTDRIDAGTERERSARYLEQMRTYYLAVREMYGEAPVSCLLYFFATNGIVECLPDVLASIQGTA